jgi:dTDP-glucose 4,6-dehydratase
MFTLLVTGGAGFIGSNLVRRALSDPDTRVITLDLLTYAGSLENLEGVLQHPRHRFVRGDVCDAALVSSILRTHRPDAVLHLAAESHVDRSIDDASRFVRTNVDGTRVMLEAARRYLKDGLAPAGFRYVQVSTDEVYGSLGAEGRFREDSPFAPNSPYAASKAAADLLVRAWHQTYALPTVTTHCCNNFGPYQFPEKLVPVVVLNALEGRALPVYGDGRQVREWMHVDDHCAALLLLAREGVPGRSYNIGSGEERTNLSLVTSLCEHLQSLAPRHGYAPPPDGYRALIRHVTDRPGHDRRYAVDCARILGETPWRPTRVLEGALHDTVAWFLDHQGWWEDARDAAHTRLGLAA